MIMILAILDERPRWRGVPLPTEHLAGGGFRLLSRHVRQRALPPLAEIARRPQRDLPRSLIELWRRRTAHLRRSWPAGKDGRGQLWDFRESGLGAIRRLELREYPRAGIPVYDDDKRVGVK
jgi:hypothetical protein